MSRNVRSFTSSSNISWPKSATQIRDFFKLSANTRNFNSKVLAMQPAVLSEGSMPFKLHDPWLRNQWNTDRKNFARNQVSLRSVHTGDLLNKACKAAKLSDTTRLDYPPCECPQKVPKRPEPPRSPCLTCPKNEEAEKQEPCPKVPPELKIIRACPADVANIIQYMRENYFQTDPVMMALGIAGPNVTLEHIIAGNLAEGSSLIAVNRSDRSQIEGVAVCHSSCIEEPVKCRVYTCKDDCTKKLLQYLSYVKNHPQLHERYSELKIFEISILSVTKELEETPLQEDLLRHAYVVGRNLGYRIARIDCTSHQKAELLKKMGAFAAWELPYDQYVNIHGDPMFVGEGANDKVQVFVENLRARKVEDFEKLEDCDVY